MTTWNRTLPRLLLAAVASLSGVQAVAIAVQRGTNHAWSNRSNNPAVVAIASHDGA